MYMNYLPCDFGDLSFVCSAVITSLKMLLLIRKVKSRNFKMLLQRSQRRIKVSSSRLKRVQQLGSPHIGNEPHFCQERSLELAFKKATGAFPDTTFPGSHTQQMDMFLIKGFQGISIFFSISMAGGFVLDMQSDEYADGKEKLMKNSVSTQCACFLSNVVIIFSA